MAAEIPDTPAGARYRHELEKRCRLAYLQGRGVLPKGNIGASQRPLFGINRPERRQEP